MSSERRSRARVGTPGWLGLLGSAGVAAALYVLASPPGDLSVLAWGVPALLLLPARDTSVGRAAAAGLCFGLGIAFVSTSRMDAGDGAAAKQHFAMAVLRAVETRRSLARASGGARR